MACTNHFDVELGHSHTVRTPIVRVVASTGGDGGELGNDHVGFYEQATGPVVAVGWAVAGGGFQNGRLQKDVERPRFERRTRANDVGSNTLESLSTDSVNEYRSREARSR